MPWTGYYRNCDSGFLAHLHFRPADPLGKSCRDNQSRSVSEFRISAVGKYEYCNPRMQQDLREFLADDPAIQRSLRLSLCLVVSP